MAQIVGVFDAIWCRGDAMPLLDILEELAAKGLVAPVNDQERRYPNHPSRVMVGAIGQWLYRGGFLDGLGNDDADVLAIRNRMLETLATVDPAVVL
ncbi:MAG: hypothetical protein ACREQF_08005, partial [Candidatus Binataceae bacterium]